MTAKKQLSELQKYLQAKVQNPEEENEAVLVMSGYQDNMNHTRLTNVKTKKGIRVVLEGEQLIIMQMENATALGSCPLFDWALLENTSKDTKAIGDVICKFLKDEDKNQ